MQRKSLLVVLVTVLAALLTLSACVPVPLGVVGSGRPVTRELDIDNFTGISAGNVFQVTVSQGDTYSVSVTADDNLWEYLNVSNEGGNLRLELRPGSYTRATLQARVTMPVLERMDLSGASHGIVQDFGWQDEFRSNVSGASRLEGELAADEAEIDLSGASGLVLEGSVSRLRLGASGASRADLRDMLAEEAEVSLSGASRAQIEVQERLDYEISGASRLEYAGDPRIGDSDVSGGSSVEHVES